MNISDLYSFINSPDTVDFVVRTSEELTAYMKDNSDVLIAQTLSGRYAICYADKSSFPQIIQALGSSFISSAPLVLGIMDRASTEAAGITQIHQQPYLDLLGRGVLIGFVDTGIDYTADIFRYEDGTTKIKCIYDQTVDGAPPQGFYIGTEYTEEEINKALQSDNPYEVVPHRDMVGHGTFLASVAAGRSSDTFTSAAPDAEIIAVKLRKARPYYIDNYMIPPGQDNVFESSAVMVGVEYIINKAHSMDRPVVICIGLGTNLGSHDGFSVLEEYLSGVSNLRGICLCTAAGNECQARHHMQGMIAARGESQNVDIRVADNSDIYLTIYNPVSDRLSASVRAPTGELIGRIPAKENLVVEQKLVMEPSAVNIEYHFPLEGSSGQLTVIKIHDATPGIWTVTMYGDIVLDGRFDAWLPITGFISEGVEFLSATPYTTITVPATMYGAISCGSYDYTNNSLYSRSSWGPTRTLSLAPEIVAPGLNIGGYYPTGYGSMSGTSVATAIVCGACALLMQWGVVMKNDVSLSTYQIRAYLIRGCERSDSMSYPNTQWGYGALNLLQTFQQMREI